jgi:hypothetical protein
MLLGFPGIKADTMVGRFVASAIGRRVGSCEAHRLVMGAARVLAVDPMQLDHAIWPGSVSRDTDARLDRASG